MATADLSVEQVLLESLDKAITETAALFLKNPWQFHGDTGIMHYLYHRMLCNGEERLFHRAAPDGAETLLFESEHYTQDLYLYSGQKESSGRLDFALLDPGSITGEGRVSRGQGRLPAIAGIEVGLEKTVEKMGDMTAEQTARSVRPGDATKLIRGIRFGQVRHGFLLEFYRDPASVGKARSVFNAVLAAVQGLAGLHVLVLVAGNRNTPPKASVYPEPWRARLGLSGCSEIELDRQANQDDGLSGLERFQKHIGRGNSFLQARLGELSKAHPRAVLLIYSRRPSPRSMTIRRIDHHLLTRITTRLDAPEELCEIDPALSQALLRAGLPLVDGRLRIPNEEDLDFVSRVIGALKTTLGLPSGNEGLPRSGDDAAFWDSLESMTGRIEAPRDWSAEHDHYLYGVPRRGEDDGE